MFSPRERWLEFSRAFQRTVNKENIRVASATTENANDFSIVADATRILILIDRALKHTAKFNLSLRDDLCTGFK